MIKSYITVDEAILLYPQTSEYEPDQQQAALDNSFSLVNSFLDGALNVPVVVEDGKVPGILKILQVRFLQWVLESSNHGYSDEIQKLFDSTAEICKKLGANELLISEAQTTSHEIGWNLSGNTISQGTVHIRGNAPELHTLFSFKVISDGTSYTADSSFEIKRSDSDEVYAVIQGSYDWQFIPDSYLEIRFDGQFTLGETFSVKGVPETLKISATKPVIKQAEVLY